MALKIINKENLVPDKTIVVVPHFLNDNSYLDIIEPLKGKARRDWFDEAFYYCLPLTVGNQYGFVIKTEFDFSFIWNGDADPKNSITFKTEGSQIDKYPRAESHFGSGIITINPPFTLRTPPGVNLMTINPPNYIIPNITVMTGVVETDNLRRNFTFNLKIGYVFGREKIK